MAGPNEPAIILTPAQQAIVDRSVIVLRKKMEIENWRVNRNDPKSAPLSAALQEVILHGYRELIDAVVASQPMYRSKLERREGDPEEYKLWKAAQGGAAARLMDYIMASQDIKKLHLTLDDKKRIVFQLAGTVINHALSTCKDKLGMAAYVDPELFGLTHARVIAGNF